MTQKLQPICHRTAFNDEQSPYRIVSNKGLRKRNVQQFKREVLQILKRPIKIAGTKFYHFSRIYNVHFLVYKLQIKEKRITLDRVIL